MSQKCKGEKLILILDPLVSFFPRNRAQISSLNLTLNSEKKIKRIIKNSRFLKSLEGRKSKYILLFIKVHTKVWKNLKRTLTSQRKTFSLCR